MPSPKEIAKAQLLESYDTFLFDCDGVLWLGDTIIPGAVDALNQLIAGGKRVVLISNNSTKTPTQLLQKVQKMGIRGIDESNIVNAALVSTQLLAQHPKRNDLPVYLCGNPSLASMLNVVGVRTIGVGADPVEKYTEGTYVMDVDISQKVFAVVASFDAHFNYIKLMKAVNYLKDPSVAFYATNQDWTFPGSVPGVIVPGAGWTSNAITVISNRQPTVCGKPHVQMFDFIHKRFNIDPKRTLMIGDRLDTDILFGSRNKIDTLLVLTGVNSLADVHKAEAKGKMDLLPRFYAQSIRIFNGEQ